MLVHEYIRSTDRCFRFAHSHVFGFRDFVAGQFTLCRTRAAHRLLYRASRFIVE